MAEKRLAFLDLLKIISIVLVILFHFLYQITSNESLRALGFVGVSLFFIVSGYSLAKNYPDHITFSFKWFFKRYVKLASVYYLAIIIIVILFFRQSYSGNLFLNLLAHFTFTDSLFRDYSYGIISPAWFLAPLIVYYLIFPFLNKLIKNNWKIIIPLFFASLLVRCIHTGDYTSTNALFFIGEFCFGIALAHYRNIWLMLIPSILIFIMPIMYLPFVIFFVSQYIQNKYLPSKILAVISGQIILLFLFHEALINILLDKWQIYSIPKYLSLAIYLIFVVITPYLSKRIQKSLSI